MVSKKKESIIRVRMGYKHPSLAITVCHHSASIGDPLDGFFYPTLNLTMGSKISGHAHLLLKLNRSK